MKWAAATLGSCVGLVIIALTIFGLNKIGVHMDYTTSVATAAFFIAVRAYLDFNL